ncbi:hypothetical protein [Luteimonas saliphila]|uniref:hypothetical protein n=1 Tax=Luteimonas saliphila TaxID=2804919 RepID=UPI00192E2DFB|nr:hypothetical protein [Luteimonas saliphila]
MASSPVRRVASANEVPLDPTAAAARVASAEAASTPAPALAAPSRVTGGRGFRRRRAASAFEPVPLQSRIDAVQPMTGIVLWNDNAAGLAALGEDVQLEFAYLRYSDVSPTSTTFDWSPVDTRLAAAAARGHQMILRFHDTYPGRTEISIPADIADGPDHVTAFHTVEGRRTFIPDWRSQRLRQFVLDFYTRFAQRYDRDPRLAFVQVGFGSYAEYHLWDGPLTLGHTFPSRAFQQQALEHLGESFVQTPWSVSIDAASGVYSPFPSVPSLRTLRFGLFDDSFMHERHSESDTEYNRAAWGFFGDARHHDGPAGGEFSYYSEYDQAHVLDLPDGPHGRSFESFAAQYRISYMIGNDQPRYQPRARIRQAAMATGYAFRVTTLESDGDCVRMAIRNEGVAPLYHDAWPAANGQRAGASLKGLLPGDEDTFQACIGPHQREALEIGIESDRLVPGQGIQFNASLT